MDGQEAGGVEGSKRLRGAGKGGKFFAIDRALWSRLWELDTPNRMNFVVTYLVIAAGTGSDHRLSKWSAKACEQNTGLGKPRAHAAIEELIRHKILSRAEGSTKLYPQYVLEPPSRETEPIFLPVALVTGVGAEASILRRVRETGDALLLRMLIDLYGNVQLDATFGLPPATLSQIPPEDFPARKIFEAGVHSIWALRLSGVKTASGDWTALHKAGGKQDTAWQVFWERVGVLEKIGALWYEPWVFEGKEKDAEPLFPVDFSVFYHKKPDDRVFALTQTMMEAARALASERPYLLDAYDADILVPLSQHRQAPTLRGVAKLRIEADTPGRRLAYYKRLEQIELYQEGFAELINDAARGDFSRPIKTSLRSH